MENTCKHLATKEDLAKAKGELDAKISQSSRELKAKISESIQWMFVFWISQVIATFGFILLFLRK